MAFVGQTANPWEVPVPRALEVMQMIWNATSPHDYKIMTNTAVYQNVCVRLDSGTKLISAFLRRSNAVQTRGEIPSGPLASQPF
jgi:hypothetical protein